MPRTINIYILDLHIYIENYVLHLAFNTQVPPHRVILKVNLGIGFSNSSDEMEKILRGLLYTFQSYLHRLKCGMSKSLSIGITLSWENHKEL